MTKFAWTQDKIDTLVKMHENGHSASEIGRVVGCSRNAVLGKAWRMGINGNFNEQARKLVSRQVALRTHRIRRKLDSIEKLFEVPKIPPRRQGRSDGHIARGILSKNEVSKKIVGVENRTPRVPDVIELEDHHCKWPIGVPGRDGFGFCGEPRAHGAIWPYCQHHILKALPSENDPPPQKFVPRRANQRKLIAAE